MKAGEGVLRLQDLEESRIIYSLVPGAKKL